MSGPRIKYPFDDDSASKSNLSPSSHNTLPNSVFPKDKAPQGTPPAPTPALNMDEVTAEQEFIEAINQYRISSGRLFPTWSEVLEVLQGLGYRKVESNESSVRAARS